MANLIVAFPDKQVSRNVSAALEAGGIRALRVCMTGNEVMRTFNQVQDGILVCAPRFPDRTADDLAEDLDGHVLILVIGRPEQLELVEHPSIFRLRLPAGRSELAASVRMLMQLHDMRKPRRDQTQEAALAAAKEKLMAACGMDEPAAHRALQRASMRMGMRLGELAGAVLDGSLPVDRVTGRE